ncbi:nucleotidyltransferase domain-containing protein [Candidatus Brocadia pituitae]|nr:nucleotidyltransferase domain-containing protein [Candidatus Brocadia pituitae]
MKQKAIELINQGFEKRKIGVNKIIIFGSRARGDYRKDSDWDFLVVIDKEIGHREKREIASEIRKNFVYSGMLADIIIISEKYYQERLNDIGNIVYYAVKEGMVV